MEYTVRVWADENEIANGEIKLVNKQNYVSILGAHHRINDSYTHPPTVTLTKYCITVSAPFQRGSSVELKLIGE